MRLAGRDNLFGTDFDDGLIITGTDAVRVALWPALDGRRCQRVGYRIANQQMGKSLVKVRIRPVRDGLRLNEQIASRCRALAAPMLCGSAGLVARASLIWKTYRIHPHACPGRRANPLEDLRIFRLVRLGHK